ncbi:NADPH-dependent FMN reductase [Sandaracinobacteroides sp. A072]|uniref:NADPH-dependent FMN reductase n=1 Tax=Sandaracinobacteroides sp. A072 TaxID=3461146 RepID=UPI004041F6EA
MTHEIAVIAGSLRRESFNRRLGQALAGLGPADMAFFNVPIGDLPLYNQDDDGAPTAAVSAFKAAVARASGVIFLTPEYNRSVPGVLKNAIDHGSRPYGQSIWAGKPAGIIGVSPGKVGAAMAQAHLRPILAFLDMPTLGQPEAFVQWTDDLLESDGSIGPGSREFLAGWMERFAAHVRLHAAR